MWPRGRRFGSQAPASPLDSLGSGIADHRDRAHSFSPKIFFELRFAFVQSLQTQLPAMQLDRELIDVTGHFCALRFVFFQLAAKFVGVSERACARTLRQRHRGLLSAFLTRQIHSRCGTRRDQRCFAMLAVKENIGIGVDFANGMHGKETSTRYASLSHIIVRAKSI